MNFFYSLLQNAQGLDFKSSNINIKILFNHDTLNVLLSFFFFFFSHLYIIGKFELVYTVFAPVFFIGVVFTFIHMRLGMQNIILDYVHNLIARTVMMYLLDLCYVLFFFSL